MSLISSNDPANAIPAGAEDARAVDNYAGSDKANVSIMSTALSPAAEVAPETPNDESDGSLDDATQVQESIERQSSESGSLHTTIVELVSTSATSSAFPESFGLSVSSTGKWILAYSSSALFILSAAHLPDHRENCRAFRLRRKPLSAILTDTGRLAVLTTPHKVDLYQCGTGDEAPLSGANQKLETVFLDNEAKALALAENGEVVAAGSDGGIEIRNLSPGAAATDKRRVQCGPLDAIELSKDGRSMLMTAAARRARNSTLISLNGGFEAALFDDEDQEEQPVGTMWISQLLFPERLMCRQAVFLPEPGSGHMNELLAFDPTNDRFGVFDVGTKQFVGKTLGTPQDFRFSRSERFDDCLPALSVDALHAAVAVRLKNNHEIWMYKVPENWADDDDAGGRSPGTESDGPRKLRPCLRSNLPPRGDNSPVEMLNVLRWLHPKDTNSLSRRLVGLVSTAAVSMPEDVVPSAAPAASGKILLFDVGAEEEEIRPPKHVVIDLDDIALTEDLVDEELELEQEVELVRRRTRVQRRQDPTSPRETRPPRRSLSSSSASGATFRDSIEFAVNRPRRRRSFSSMSSMSEENDIIPLAVDEPYSHSQPRTQFQLQRAASVSASSPAARLHLRALPNRPLEYRRADGLREMPHESDADNWVPPPPPYSERPDHTVSHPVSAFPNAAATMAAQRPNVVRSQRLSPTAAVPPVPAVRLAMPSTRAPRMLQVPVGSNISTPTTQPSLRPTLPPTHQGPRQPPSSILTPAAVPAPAPAPALAPTLPLSAPPTADPPAPVVSRRPVPTQQAAQFRPAPPLNPPGPGALQSPMTFPPGRHPHRLSTPALQMDSSQQTNQPRAASTPASPVSQNQSSMVQSNTATADFAPARALPTPDQLDSLRRRSSSGSCPPTPRAAVGARGQGHVRQLPSAELMRPLPPLPPGSQEASDRPNADGSLRPPSHERRVRRPTLTRLATIASAGDPATDDAEGRTATRVRSQPISSVPGTPTASRRQWWKIGGSPPPATMAQEPGRASQLSNVYAVQSPQTRSSPAESTPGYSGRGSPKEKVFRCIIM